MFDKECMMRILTIATLTASLGLALPAHAGDTKFYPGTLCHAGGTLPASYANTGAVYNTLTNQEIFLNCPLVRDVERADALGWNTLTINALNMTPKPNLRFIMCSAE